MRRPALVLAAATLAAFLPSLGGAFQFDDYNVIVDYPRVHSWDAFGAGLAQGLRPLLQASYTLNWMLQPAPLGFLLVNVALHALNVTLVWQVGRRLFPAYAGAAFVAALLFALHPAQTEAVSYISGRSVSLMAAFYLTAIVLHLDGRAAWSCLAFIAALATRETAVTLPAALLFIDALRGRIEWRRHLPYWLILAAGALVLLAAPRYHALVSAGFAERSLADNLVTQIGGVSYLVLRLVGLHGYNIDPALPTLDSLDGVVLLQAFLFLSLLVLGLACTRRRPWITFGILWFFLQLAPTNSIVPRLDVANDRQLYLACWGLFLALSIQVSQFAWKRVIAVALIAAFALTSVLRQIDYHDEITLWEATVRESPWNARARNNLGYAYYLAGRKAEARREIEAALVFDPRFEKARMNIRMLDWK